MITVNREACIGCGQCVHVCPFTVLKMDEEKKAVNTGKPCILCMHCAAICPKGAITYQGQSAVTEPVSPLSPQCADNLRQLVYQRRSYRKFLPKPIPEEILQEALDAAMMAPSAKNQHPTKWIIVEQSSIQEQLMDHILRHCKEKQISPELFVERESINNPVIGNNATLIIGIGRDNAINANLDTAIAMTTADLMLQSRGIGTCWAGYLNRYINDIPACRELLQIPEGYHACGSLLAGCPDQVPYRYIPARLVKAEVTRF